MFENSFHASFKKGHDWKYHRDRCKPRERMSLCTVLEAMWRIENKESAVLKPKQN